MSSLSPLGYGSQHEQAASVLQADHCTLLLLRGVKLWLRLWAICVLNFTGLELLVHVVLHAVPRVLKHMHACTLTVFIQPCNYCASGCLTGT